MEEIKGIFYRFPYPFYLLDPCQFLPILYILSILFEIHPAYVYPFPHHD